MRWNTWNNVKAWTKCQELKLHILTFCAFWILAVAGLSELFGQTAANARPAFDVVSVKPNVKGGPFVDHVPKRSGDRVTMHNCELGSMVAWAYGMRNGSYQVIPGHWQQALGEEYDVDAIAPASTTDADLHLMFQSFLDERFRFKMHREDRQLTAYDLVVARGGSRLVAAKQGPKVSLGFGGSSSWVEIRGAGPHLVGMGASMAELTVVLSGQLNAPVRDHTGIVGSFDYNLPFSAGTDSSDFPFVGTAIHGLGLDLKKTKGKFDVRVVDNVGKLSLN